MLLLASPERILEPEATSARIAEQSVDCDRQHRRAAWGGPGTVDELSPPPGGCRSAPLEADETQELNGRVCVHRYLPRLLQGVGNESHVQPKGVRPTAGVKVKRLLGLGLLSGCLFAGSDILLQDLMD